MAVQPRNHRATQEQTRAGRHPRLCGQHGERSSTTGERRATRSHKVRERPLRQVRHEELRLREHPRERRGQHGPLEQGRRMVGLHLPRAHPLGHPSHLPIRGRREAPLWLRSQDGGGKEEGPLRQQPKAVPKGHNRRRPRQGGQLLRPSPNQVRSRPHREPLPGQQGRRGLPHQRRGQEGHHCPARGGHSEIRRVQHLTITAGQ